MSALFLLVFSGCGPQEPSKGGASDEVCDNAADDDEDGRIDCDDADCGCPEVCDNVRDDNGDGLLDCEDPTCAEACTEDCDSGEDEDRDGLVDCDDPDCPGPCSERCDGGEDEDEDGLVDCLDSDCADVCDVDGDGFIGVASGGDDCDDADPWVHPDMGESCNGYDDDCDGAVDDDDDEMVDGTDVFVDDDGDTWGDDGQRLSRCSPLAGTVDRGGDCDDNDEDVHPGAAEICDGGVDDDCDGAADDLDPGVDPASYVDLYDDGDGDGVGVPPATDLGCLPEAGQSATADDCDDADDTVFPGAAEVCTGGIDDDCDTDVDCDDVDCATDPDCQVCVDAVLPAGLPLVQGGDTTGRGDDHAPTCVLTTAPDVALSWTPPAPGVCTIDTAGSSFDTVLYVLETCAGVVLGCNDDDVVLGLQSKVVVTLTTTDPVVIVVDGFSTYSGPFVLNIY